MSDPVEGGELGPLIRANDCLDLLRFSSTIGAVLSRVWAIARRIFGTVDLIIRITTGLV